MEYIVAAVFLLVSVPLGLWVIATLNRWELEGPKYPVCVECDTDIYDMKQARHYFTLSKHPQTGKRSNWWHLGCAQMAHRRAALPGVAHEATHNGGVERGEE